MWTTYESLAVFGLLCVMAVLLLGVASMAAGGKNETENSDTLMHWRVGLQAVAVLLLVAGAVFTA